MIDIEEAKVKAYKNAGHNAYFGNGFSAGVEFSESYIPITDSLPSIENGYVDELVLVCVKNKNKEDGIILWDVCGFDGESWCERGHTWEKIIGWRPIIRSKNDRY